MRRECVRIGWWLTTASLLGFSLRVDGQIPTSGCEPKPAPSRATRAVRVTSLIPYQPAVNRVVEDAKADNGPSGPNRPGWNDPPSRDNESELTSTPESAAQGDPTSARIPGVDKEETSSTVVQDSRPSPMESNAPDTAEPSPFPVAGNQDVPPVSCPVRGEKAPISVPIISSISDSVLVLGPAARLLEWSRTKFDARVPPAPDVKAVSARKAARAPDHESPVAPIPVQDDGINTAALKDAQPPEKQPAANGPARRNENEATAIAAKQAKPQPESATRETASFLESWLKNYIQAACGKNATVQVKLRSSTELNVRLIVQDQEDAEQLGRKIMDLPELAVYKVALDLGVDCSATMRREPRITPIVVRDNVGGLAGRAQADRPERGARHGL